MASISDHIKITNIGRLRIITFDNPKKNNAINKNAYIALAAALNAAAVDDSVTVVALTGAGAYYSSGNDLSGMMQEDDFEAARERSLDLVRSVVQAFILFPKLLVAVVNGPCIGIAATTIPLCDVVYASENVNLNLSI